MGLNHKKQGILKLSLVVGNQWCGHEEPWYHMKEFDVLHWSPQGFGSHPRKIGFRGPNAPTLCKTHCVYVLGPWHCSGSPWAFHHDWKWSNSCIGLCLVTAGMRLRWGHDPCKILAFFLSLWSEREDEQGEGEALIPQHPSEQGVLSEPLDLCLMATNKDHNGFGTYMVRKPRLADSPEFKRTLNIGIYFIIQSSIKYLSSIYCVHAHQLTTGTQRWGKDIPWILTCP